MVLCDDDIRMLVLVRNWLTDNGFPHKARLRRLNTLVADGLQEMRDIDDLTALAEKNGYDTYDLAEQLNVLTDSLSGGGLREIVELAVRYNGDDTELVRDLIIGDK